MKKALILLVVLLSFASISVAQEPLSGEIIEKDIYNRVITVNLGTKDGIKVGSAFVLYDANDRELGCILVADVGGDVFVSDLIPIKYFKEIEVGYHVEELGSGCRIEGVQVVYIPEGYFGMGDTKRDNEMPVHGVKLDAFYIDKYEVSNDQYKVFLDHKKREAPHLDSEEAGPFNWKDGNFPEGKADHPVTLVSVEAAQAYCEYSGKRLPTEAEWEKAARGTGNRIWPWGNVWDPKKLNNKDNGADGTEIIGSYPDDLSPYDLLDMGGNVSEWTSSIYEPYDNNYIKDENYGKGYHVVRGGSFLDGKFETRTSSRKFADPKTKAINIGFRCVKDID